MLVGEILQKGIRSPKELDMIEWIIPSVLKEKYGLSRLEMGCMCPRLLWGKGSVCKTAWWRKLANLILFIINWHDLPPYPSWCLSHLIGAESKVSITVASGCILLCFSETLLQFWLIWLVCHVSSSVKGFHLQPSSWAVEDSNCLIETRY